MITAGKIVILVQIPSLIPLIMFLARFRVITIKLTSILSKHFKISMWHKLAPTAVKFGEGELAKCLTSQSRGNVIIEVCQLFEV